MPKKPRTFIYILEDPFTREWRYVGKTEQPNVRFKNHCNEKSDTHRSHWIQSLIRRGRKPRMKIIAEVPTWANWKDCERMWIDYARRSGWPLTNGTEGGDGVIATAEVREKISKSRKGQKLSPYQRLIFTKNLIKSKSGTTLSAEICRKISESRIGMKFSAAHRRNISQSKRRLGDEQVANIRQRLASGQSQSSIAEIFSVSQATICAINRNNRKFLRSSNAT